MTIPTLIHSCLVWLLVLVSKQCFLINKEIKLRKEYIINKPNPKGTFSFKIPLKHIFGFCEDYDKILYGMKQTLILTRNNDNDAIFRVNVAANGKIVLDKIS